jgi:hypothetical protein
MGSVDASGTAVLPTHLGNLLYPVLPDVAYELDHLFDKPAVVLTGSFMNSMITMRRSSALKVAAALKRASDASDADANASPATNSTLTTA